MAVFSYINIYFSLDSKRNKKLFLVCNEIKKKDFNFEINFFMLFLMLNVFDFKNL